MEVTVSGADINLEFEYKNIGDVLDAIEAENCVVLEVIADGQNISDFNESELAQIQPINKLEIVARNVEELTIETLKEADRFIPGFMTGIEEIIDKFSQGLEAEAYNMLTKVIDTLQWLTSLLSTIDRLVDLNGINFNQEEFLSNWNNALEELLNAMENQDIILLNDILEYEITPALEDYHDLVKELLNQLT